MKTRLLIMIVTIVIGIMGIVIFASNVEEEEIEEFNPVFFEGYPRVHQNDRWCSTTWIVHYENSIDSRIIQEQIQQKISEFGDKYDIAERSITIKSLDENSSRISVQGVWNKTFENEGPFLTSFMKTLGFVSVEEPRVVCA